MTELRSVVITGVGAVSPAGIGAPALWRAARDGVPSGGPIAGFDASANASRIAAHVPNFDPAALGLDAAAVARMDRVTQFAVVAAREAFADSGLCDGAVRPDRAGVMIGTAVGGVGRMEAAFRCACRPNGAAKPAQVEIEPQQVGPEVYDGFLAHSISIEVARDLGFLGACSTLATGCTAGADALMAAADWIATGDLDVCVTGGADAPITPIVLTAFDNIHCLTRRNDRPRAASRPFDRDRDGFLLAEGCGILVIEEELRARRRGAHVHGRLLGTASLSNAYHMTGLPADGAALARTLRRALAKANLAPDAVDYVNAHGSSTPQNDRNETAAFKAVFGPRAQRVPISSTKSVLGHSLGAASALECIVCLKALEEAVIPPTANYETPCRDCDLDYVPLSAREARLSVVECNASGFSGIHTSLLFGHANGGTR